jgi:hypothetical protein
MVKAGPAGQAKGGQEQKGREDLRLDDHGKNHFTLKSSGFQLLIFEGR